MWWVGDSIAFGTSALTRVVSRFERHVLRIDIYHISGTYWGEGMAKMKQSPEAASRNLRKLVNVAIDAATSEDFAVLAEGIGGLKALHGTADSLAVSSLALYELATLYVAFHGIVQGIIPLLTTEQRTTLGLPEDEP
jgi:hypothetical protein